MKDIEAEIKKKKAYIWTFGKNGDGELGLASQKDTFLPRPILIQHLKIS